MVAPGLRTGEESERLAAFTLAASCCTSVSTPCLCSSSSSLSFEARLSLPAPRAPALPPLGLLRAGELRRAGDDVRALLVDFGVSAKRPCVDCCPDPGEPEQCEAPPPNFRADLGVLSRSLQSGTFINDLLDGFGDGTRKSGRPLMSVPVRPPAG